MTSTVSLSAARLTLSVDRTIADMMPGSNEQTLSFSSNALPTPNSNAAESERWVLIDRTCQIMFIGTAADTAFVLPTSKGSEGVETRDQDRAEAFRFNPALDNGGWHDSSEFPVGVDNPLNGNLYKPLYFDLGQAIHGANKVPATPQSKGCAAPIKTPSSRGSGLTTPSVKRGERMRRTSPSVCRANSFRAHQRARSVANAISCLSTSQGVQTALPPRARQGTTTM
jgi:hypothetical protein